MTHDTRTCTRCDTTKPVEDFAKDKHKKSGRKSACKECDRKKAKHYYEKAGRTKRGHTRMEDVPDMSPIEPRECPTCGTVFKPENRSGTYCSRACHGISKRTPAYRPHRKPRADIPTQAELKVCGVCETLFAAPKATSVNCSTDCTQKARRIRENRKSLKRLKWMRETTIEPIDPLDIYDRDNWECQLCGDKIDPSIKWPGPKSPSLDHIRPISWGGHHVAENLQASHLRCNIQRGARGDMDEAAIKFREKIAQQKI